jgi:hypothetical protein
LDSAQVHLRGYANWFCRVKKGANARQALILSPLKKEARSVNFAKDQVSMTACSDHRCPFLVGRQKNVNEPSKMWLADLKLDP